MSSPSEGCRWNADCRFQLRLLITNQKLARKEEVVSGYLYLSALGPGSVSWFMAAFKAGLGGTGSSAQTSCWLQVWSNGCAGAVPTLVTGDPALLYIDSRNCLSQHLIAVPAPR